MRDINIASVADNYMCVVNKSWANNRTTQNNLFFSLAHTHTDTHTHRETRAHAHAHTHAHHPHTPKKKEEKADDHLMIMGISETFIDYALITGREKYLYTLKSKCNGWDTRSSGDGEVASFL